MTSVTFTSLSEDVRRYLEAGYSNDPVVYDQIPRLINLAEQRIIREIKVTQFLRAVTFDTQIGVASYLKPDRWRETVSMMIDGVPVLPRAYEYIRFVYPDSVTGQPELYADYDYQHWLLGPAPDDVYTVNLLYYERPEPLSDSNQVSIITENMPDLILYATLLEAAPFMKSDERVQIWQGLYDRAAQALVAEDRGRVLDRGAQREGN